MEFCLFYEGKLKSRDNAHGKHQIRQYLHGQMRSLCNSVRFQDSFRQDESGITGIHGKNMFVEHGDKKFWFLISEHACAVVDLSITLLVPHDVGKIVQNGGDLDNRIKTLFDALRVPAVQSEIPSSDTFQYGTEGMYCLLQDDKLIDRIAIKSYKDHSSVAEDHVRCIIEVSTKITQASMYNLHYL